MELIGVEGEGVRCASKKEIVPSGLNGVSIERWENALKNWEGIKLGPVLRLWGEDWRREVYHRTLRLKMMIDVFDTG